MNKEEWRIIEGFPNYMVSDKGRVRNLKTRTTLSSNNGKDQSRSVKITDKNGKRKRFTIAQLVAKTFIPNPNNYISVGHFDHRKQNNCVENLYWIKKVSK